MALHGEKRVNGRVSTVVACMIRHIFGRRLRAPGVSYEDRQDLLGHKSGRITTHYSKAELNNLLQAVERLCEDKSRKIRVIKNIA